MILNRIDVGVFGAGGRMGQKNLASVLADQALKLVAATARKDSPLFGQDVGQMLGSHTFGLKLSDNLDEAFSVAKVMIDFSSPAGTLSCLAQAIKHRTALVIGTTGFTKAELAEVQSASKKIPIVFSGNYSLGVNVLTSLVKKASALLKEFDIEIVEHHHNQKKDAPSGTALMLGRAAAEARDQALEQVALYGREGQVGARKKGEIGFHAVRGGGVIGRHEVFLFSQNETIELTHVAQSREAFTSGVVLAVKWVNGKEPGFYDMTHVLGI
jgi:4-hydroxy-tetrahydrodipicolinate reductase